MSDTGEQIATAKGSKGPHAMTMPPTPPPVSGSAATAPAGGRLRNGELRRQVAVVLADRAGTDLSPRTIAQLLGRSSGAVGNALAVLAHRDRYARTLGTDPPRTHAAPHATTDGESVDARTCPTG